MLIDPAFAACFEIREVNHAAHGVLRVACDEKIANVIVSVEVLALATMAIEAMSCTELDATHDR